VPHDVDDLGPTLAERLGAWVVDLQLDRIPPDVVAKAKLCLLDFLGLAVVGASLPQMAPVAPLIDQLGAREECSVAGARRRTALPYAAFANAAYGHSCEFDDSHIACGHPGVCVIPTALACAEREGLGGRAVLEAVVAGYQAMAVAIGPVHPQMIRTGWHGMKVSGVFGAAAATGKLLGLTAAQLTHALAIAASDAGGTTEYDQSGGEVKRFHAGMAVRSGIEAALLAQAGLTGPPTIFEGPRGVRQIFGGGLPAERVVELEGRFHLLDTMFKLYPAAGTLHAALDGFREIRRRLSFDADQIESIEVGLIDFAILHGAAIVRPPDPISAQFSLAFSLGLCAITGANRLPDYLDRARWEDGRILGVAERVRPFEMAKPPGASDLFADVTVRLRDGRTDREAVAAPRGFPTHPATAQDIEGKARSVLEGLRSPEQIGRLMEDLDRLEDLDTVEPLIRFLAASPVSVADQGREDERT